MGLMLILFGFARFQSFGRIFFCGTREDISPDFELALFGCSDPILASTHSQQLSLMFALVLTKRCVTRGKCAHNVRDHNIAQHQTANVM